MIIPSFSPAMIVAIVPEILLLVLAGVILGADLLLPDRGKRVLGWFSALGLAAVLVITLSVSAGGPEGLIFGGMLRRDGLALAFRLLFLFSGAVTCLLSLGLKGVAERGEYYALMVVSILGMNLMAAAADLIMLYLAIESTSIPLYVLAGFIKRDDKSTESGLKYFLFGALTSTVMLYGFTLLYGMTGETNLYRLAEAFQASGLTPWVLVTAAALILVGFSFKVAAVPFHFWTPDVYEGAPTPITAFISTASKAAGFVVLVRVMLAVFPAIEPYWTGVLAAIAAGTMTLGNLLALAQKNIKRLLAYSSIAHAGYALIGVVALSQFGAASTLFYLAAYVVTNLAAFAIVILFARSAGSEEIADYAGLSRRSPGLALALLVALLSLAGMPPLAGFVAKFYVFAAAVESGWIWLAFVGVLNAIVGLYYYLTVLKVVYLYRSEQESRPITVPPACGLALTACIAVILVIGSLSGPWLAWAETSAQGLF
ncbi:MAG: NADH-quinone oxidoreductase subunit N [Chloroflexota bacterium]